jgi:hypothetical protein
MGESCAAAEAELTAVANRIFTGKTWSAVPSRSDFRDASMSCLNLSWSCTRMFCDFQGRLPKAPSSMTALMSRSQLVAA